MPSIAIYLPADLKARMDNYDDTINWSRLAQRSFEQAITEHQGKATAMTSIKERLRASKAASEARERERGRRDGLHFAQAAADYDDLQALNAFSTDLSAPEDRLWDILVRWFDTLTQRSPRDLIEDLTREKQPVPSDPYVQAFVTAALEVLDAAENEPDPVAKIETRA